MQPEQVTRWLGRPRFQRYLDARGGCHDSAVSLYEWNVRISAAFLEILGPVEVLLRNSIDREFPATDRHAPLSILDADVWLCSPSTLTVESRRKVDEAISRLHRERKRPTRDRVIASLSSGFWQALFSGTYEGALAVHDLQGLPPRKRQSSRGSQSRRADSPLPQPDRPP